MYALENKHSGLRAKFLGKFKFLSPYQAGRLIRLFPVIRDVRKKNRMTQQNPTHNQKLLQNSNRIAAILAVLTAVLVCITIWYAYSTQKMANIMASDFEMSNRPYIAIRSMDNEKKAEGFLFWYALSNNGKTPAIVTEINVLGLDTTGNNQKNLEKSNRQFILHPGEFIKKNLVTITQENYSQNYRIKLQVSYKSPSQKESRYETMYLYKYKGNGVLAVIDSDAK